MRTLLMGALAATLVGCSCLPPKAGMESCADANRFACFDRTAASHPIEPEPASFKTNSATIEIKSTIAAKTERPSLVHPRDTAHRASTIISAKVESPASRTPPSPRSLKARLQSASNSAAAATAVAEQVTATPVPAPEQKANNRDRSNRAETAMRGDAEKTAPASPNDTDHLVALLIARPQIKSVSDLTGKTIAIDDRHSESVGNVRTAIVAAGAAEIQLSDGQTKAINRLISEEVPAAVLALLSPEAAEKFPEIAGFKIFRIPLSPRPKRQIQ